MSFNVSTAGQGPPMLLLHGFTGTANDWQRQIEPWSASHRVITPDLLGHGGSDAPEDPAAYALERQAADLADLLELLEARPATVVGYSMGARLALVLALEHPALVLPTSPNVPRAALPMRSSPARSNGMAWTPSSKCGRHCRSSPARPRCRRPCERSSEPSDCAIRPRAWQDHCAVAARAR